MRPGKAAMPFLLLLAACGRPGEDTPGVADAAAFSCAADNGGLRLPDGFCAGVVADNLGFIRHLALDDSGHLYVTLRNQRLGLGGLVRLVDGDGDGRMDGELRINDEPGLGIAVWKDALYFASDHRIWRYALAGDGVAAAGAVVVEGFPGEERHAGKALAVDGEGNLYVNVGAPSNACQVEEGVPGSPGRDPCPELERHAGIWRFPGDPARKDFARDGLRFASGIRNAYALDWHAPSRALLIVQHGRDQLPDLWPGIYSAGDGARLPAEEMFAVTGGSVGAWPYCYFDGGRNTYVAAPEYGGDGEKAERCRGLETPIIAFPAHFGPNDLVVYRGGQFPDRYRDGAFIAFHGSYDRGPFGQVGYQVAFVPYTAAGWSRDWEVFADGFSGADQVARPEDAEHRPTGLAVGPDGSLYIADSVQGRVWRVLYRGVPAGDQARR